MNHFFGFRIIQKKNGTLQVASCEQALTKTNRKPNQNHQRKTLLLSKTFTLEFEFDRHLEHMFSYQRMQCGLPVAFVGEFGTFVIFCKKMTVRKSLIFRISPTANIKIDHILADCDHVLPLTDPKSTLLRF